MTGDPRIVYVVESFPAYSQTFIQNEIRAIRAQGVDPLVLSLYPLHDLEDPTAGDIPHRLLASPSRHPARLAAAALRAALSHPIGLGRAALLVAARPSRLQLHAFGKALLLVDTLRGTRVERLHAHFARASASVAMLGATMLRARFSFTAHAVDIFWRPFDVDRKLRRADVTVTVCDYNRHFIEGQWPGLGTVAVIPCGVDTAQFERRRPYRTSPFTVVAVGRLVEKKGFDDLVAACDILRARGVDVRCRIVGDGEERARLEAMVADRQLEGVVVLTGSRTPEEVRSELEDATVFCLPCRIDRFGNRDSQPVVVKEAMSMELPVVGTREVALPEVVDETVGLLVPPRDPDALADALADLAARRAEDLETMGRRARARVREQFSITDGASALLRAFGRR